MFQAEEAVNEKARRQEHPWRNSKEASVAEASEGGRVVDEDPGG